MSEKPLFTKSRLRLCLYAGLCLGLAGSFVQAQTPVDVFTNASGVISGNNTATSHAIHSNTPADDFTLASRTRIRGFSIWLGDSAGNNNGNIDNFSGTLSWQLYTNITSLMNWTTNYVSSGSGTASIGGGTISMTDTGFQTVLGGDVVRATVTWNTGPTLNAGTYYLAVREGAWGSASDGSGVFWYRSDIAHGGNTFATGVTGTIFSAISPFANTPTTGNLSLVISGLTDPTIGLSTPVNSTVIQGGTGTLGITVDNTASTGGDNLNYSISNSSLLGTLFGSPSPAVAALGTAATPVAHTFTAATSGTTPIGNNTITFTVTDPLSSNTSQNLDTTLTVLDNADASFAATDTNSLTIDLGSFSQNLTPVSVPIAFDIHNLTTTAGFTAGLDLDGYAPGAGDTELSLTSLTGFANLAETLSQLVNGNVSFDISNVGLFTRQFTLNLSDANLPGAATQSLTLILEGEVTAIPEPATFAGLLAGACLLLSRRGKRTA